MNSRNPISIFLKLKFSCFLFFVFYIIYPTENVSAITSVNTSNKNVVINGLVAHWTFDGKDTTWTTSATGTTRDLSGNGNTGTLTNMNLNISPKLGKVGQSFDFKGTSNQQISFGSPASLDDIETQGGGGMTLSMWISPRTFGEGSIGTIMNKNNAANTSNGAWVLLFAGSGSLEFSKSYSTTLLSRVVSNGTISLNKWQYVTVTWDGSSTASNVHIYVNGVEASYHITTDGVGTKISDASNSISVNDGVGSREYDGKIDDVRIYKRVLTTKEIQALYKAGGGTTQSSVSNTKANTNSVGISSGLLAHYTFDGKDTTWTSSTTGTTRDLSGRGKTGTLFNMKKNSTPILGKIGQGLNFNGTTNEIVLPSSVTDSNDTTITVSAWIKPSTISGEHAIFGPDIDNSWYIGQFGDALAWRRGFSSFGITSSFWSGAGVVKNNQWQFVTFVGTPSKLAIYLNGNLIASSSTEGMVTGSTAEPRIGSSGSRFFKGSLDDVRIYNRALSLKEIQTLYKLGQTSTGVTQTTSLNLKNGLVGHWGFDGRDTTWTSSSTGSTRDLSGTGNTGTFASVNRNTSPGLGIIGQGFKFFGTDTGTRVYKSNPVGMSNMSSFTVSAWVKHATTTNERTVFYLREASNAGWSAGFNGTSIRFTSHNTCSGPIINIGTITDTTKWHHVVWKVDGTTYSIYKDGVLQGISVSTPECTFVTPESAEVGSTWSRFYNGTLDDVRVYNRAISDAEIKALYKMGSQ